MAADPERIDFLLRRCLTKINPGRTLFLSLICTTKGQPIAHAHTKFLPDNGVGSDSITLNKPDSSSSSSSSSRITASSHRPNSSASTANLSGSTLSSSSSSASSWFAHNQRLPSVSLVHPSVFPRYMVHPLDKNIIETSTYSDTKAVVYATRAARIWNDRISRGTQILVNPKSMNTPNNTRLFYGCWITERIEEVYIAVAAVYVRVIEKRSKLSLSRLGKERMILFVLAAESKAELDELMYNVAESVELLEEDFA